MNQQRSVISRRPRGARGGAGSADHRQPRPPAAPTPMWKPLTRSRTPSIPARSHHRPDRVKPSAKPSEPRRAGCKLVAQDAADEPAADLLGRIAREKVQLLKVENSKRETVCRQSMKAETRFNLPGRVGPDAAPETSTISNKWLARLG
jgi:hypothetical protein